MKDLLKNKWFLLTAAAVLLVLIIGAAVIPSAAQRSQVREQLALGERYLAEFDYESAVLAYQKVLEIDPANADAYLGLARAQIGLGDREAAYNTLKLGLEMTGDTRLTDYAASQNLALANPGTGAVRPEREILGAEWLEEKIAAWFKKTPSELTQADYDSITHLAFDSEHVVVNRKESIDGDSSYSLGGGTMPPLEPDTSAFASVIARCPNLTSLSCYMEAVTYSYLKEIPTLSGLKELTVYSAHTEDLSWLASFTELQDLSIHLTMADNANVTEDMIVRTDWLKPLSGLRALSMYASVHLIQLDLSGLQSVPELQRLHLTANVLDFSPLNSLKQMENLSIYAHAGGGESAAFDIHVTAGMPELQNLEIGRYSLSDLSVLASLKNLTDLSLSSNGLSDISALSGLTKLRWVRLNDNPITDWSPLDHVDNVSGRPDDWVRK